MQQIQFFPLHHQKASLSFQVTVERMFYGLVVNLETQEYLLIEIYESVLFSLKIYSCGGCVCSNDIKLFFIETYIGIPKNLSVIKNILGFISFLFIHSNN